MKLKFLFVVLACAAAYDAYAISTGTLCCDIDKPEYDGGCKCYADADGSCLKCYGTLPTDCSDCESTDWAPDGEGIESKINASCFNNRCSKMKTRRCAAGYYGKLLYESDKCTRCPSSGGVYGTTVAGATAITDCYIPASAEMNFSDSTGSGKMQFTTDCYYTE